MPLLEPIPLPLGDEEACHSRRPLSQHKENASGTPQTRLKPLNLTPAGMRTSQNHDRHHLCESSRNANPLITGMGDHRKPFDIDSRCCDSLSR